jgi:hypothetical protein
MGINRVRRYWNLKRLTTVFFYTFAICILFFLKYIFDILGTTGFDSKVSKFVSISSYEITLVKPNFNFLNGEDNYALAA